MTNRTDQAKLLSKAAIGLRAAFVLFVLVSASTVSAQTEAPAQRLPEADDFYIHEFHATQLDFDCSVCHLTAEEDSVVMARPGHDQCLLCHEDKYESDINAKFCGQCHADFPPLSGDDLLPFPLYKKQRAILFDFSHAQHVDPENMRPLNARTE